MKRIGVDIDDVLYPWHAFTLMEFMDAHPGFDTRWPS